MGGRGTVKAEANKVLCFLENLKGNTANPQGWPCHCSGESLQWLPLGPEGSPRCSDSLPASHLYFIADRRKQLAGDQELLLPEVPPHDLQSLNVCAKHLVGPQWALFGNARSFFSLVLMYCCQQASTVAG